MTFVKGRTYITLRLRKNLHKLTQLYSQFSPNIRICFGCNIKHSQECFITYPSDAQCPSVLLMASEFWLVSFVFEREAPKCETEVRTWFLSERIVTRLWMPPHCRSHPHIREAFTYVLVVRGSWLLHWPVKKRCIPGIVGFFLKVETSLAVPTTRSAYWLGFVSSVLTTP